MTDRDLITKLNSLKNINPDAEWLNSNRDLLLSQISNSGARDLSAWKVFIINLGSLAKAASKPAYALGAFVVILITGSIFSHSILASAKPNDSLYIARIISEKAKLNTMFNSDERNKLAVQFATQNAQDISAVLADTQFNNNSNKDQVEKLNASFNKEIDTVKTRISYLSPKTIKTDVIDNDAKVSDTVSMANSLKDKEGVQLLEDQKNLVTTPAGKATSVLNITPKLPAVETVATTTADMVLNEAKQLFDKKDYTKAADKLKEVDEMIKN